MSALGWALIRSKQGFAADESQWVGQKQLGGEASREATPNGLISSSRSRADSITQRVAKAVQRCLSNAIRPQRRS
jgi:hypothetical protein